MAQHFVVHPTHPQPRLIRQAAAILRDGGVIAYPTDSSYALGCHVGDSEAAKRMRAIRGLGDAHFLTLVCRDLADAGHYARLANWQFKIVRQGIPGTYTFLLPATREVPRRLQHPKRNTVGLRVPDHPVVAALLAELARADPVDDADPAGFRCAAQRSRRDPRTVAAARRPRDRRGPVPRGADDRRRPGGRTGHDRAAGRGRSRAARPRVTGVAARTPGATGCGMR